MTVALWIVGILWILFSVVAVWLGKSLRGSDDFGAGAVVVLCAVMAIVCLLTWLVLLALR